MGSVSAERALRQRSAERGCPNLCFTLWVIRALKPKAMVLGKRPQQLEAVDLSDKVKASGSETNWGAFIFLCDKSVG